MHFLLHGVHHLLPMDPMRLVFPPVLTILFIGPFYFLFRCTPQISQSKNPPNKPVKEQISQSPPK